MTPQHIAEVRSKAELIAELIAGLPIEDVLCQIEAAAAWGSDSPRLARDRELFVLFRRIRQLMEVPSG